MTIMWLTSLLLGCFYSSWHDEDCCGHPKREVVKLLAVGGNHGSMWLDARGLWHGNERALGLLSSHDGCVQHCVMTVTARTLDDTTVTCL